MGQERIAPILGYFSELDFSKPASGVKNISFNSFSTRQIGDETTRERRCFISSLPAEAEAFANAVRGHWGIENSLHYVLDVAYLEQLLFQSDFASESG
jgi:predicted transposase YbfD/YdcC